MRILIVDTCYPAFLGRHYAADPHLAGQSYGRQWRALMDTCFGTSDAYSHYLGRLGHEAQEVVANCEPLQAAWAREQRLEDARTESIVLSQARKFEPDVVYVQHVHFLSAPALAELRAISGFLVGQIATEPPSARRLSTFDLLVTCLPSFRERFRSHGIPSELLRIGFDARVLDRVQSEGLSRDRFGVAFVGSLGRTQHRRSNALIAQASRRVPIEFWGYNARLWPPWSPVKRRYHGEAWGLDMYRILYQSQVALNRHGTIAGRSAVNMRLYEATGMGAFLVTDRKDDLGELFEDGREIVSYETADDLVEKIRYYVANDDERRTIAEAGQRRTLSEHTYAERMRDLVAILEQHRP